MSLAHEVMKNLIGETPDQQRARELRECHEQIDKLEEQEKRRPKSPLDQWVESAFNGSKFQI